MTVVWWAHYKIGKIESIEDIKKFFDEKTMYDLNWIFLSTSGVHGSGISLDEALRIGLDSITVLIVQPRLCNLYYGQIDFSEENVEYLRYIVNKSLEGIIKHTEESLM